MLDLDRVSIDTRNIIAAERQAEIQRDREREREREEERESWLGVC